MTAHRILRFSRDLLLLLALGVVGLGALLYSLWGVRAEVLKGRSMEPTLSDGSLVITRRAEPQVGDIIRFRYNGFVAMHRIVATREDGSFATKGDNTSLYPEAQPVPREDVLGVYVASLPPMLGLWGFVFDHAIGLALVIVAGTVMWMLMIGYVRGMRSVRHPLAATAMGAGSGSAPTTASAGLIGQPDHPSPSLAISLAERFKRNAGSRHRGDDVPRA
jgi:signal peptidase I